MTETKGVDITSIRPEPKRDRWGRYVIDGKSYQRATTLAGLIDDRFNLEAWGKRMTAKGIAERDDLRALAHSLDPTADRKALNKVCGDAVEQAKGSEAANLGTALHRMVENSLIGGPPPPDEYAERVNRLTTAMLEHGVEADPDGVERIVLNDDIQVAGTSDMLPVTLADGRRLVADLKTGRTLDFSWQSISIQMAIDANHTRTDDPDTDKTGPRINVDLDQALIVHLPATLEGHCDLYLVDIAAGANAMATALEVKEWRRKKDWAEVYKPISVGTGGAPAVRDWLADRVRTIAATGQVHELVNRWPDTVPQPLPDEPTDEQTDTFDKVLTNVEALLEIPFGDPRPGTVPK